MSGSPESEEGTTTEYCETQGRTLRKEPNELDKERTSENSEYTHTKTHTTIVARRSKRSQRSQRSQTSLGPTARFFLLLFLLSCQCFTFYLSVLTRLCKMVGLFLPNVPRCDASVAPSLPPLPPFFEPSSCSGRLRQAKNQKARPRALVLAEPGAL